MKKNQEATKQRNQKNETKEQHFAFVLIVLELHENTQSHSNMTLTDYGVTQKQRDIYITLLSFIYFLLYFPICSVCSVIFEAWHESKAVCRREALKKN